MTGPVFVDTNVIVYRYDTKDPKKQVRADDWHTLVLEHPFGQAELPGLAGVLRDADAETETGQRFEGGWLPVPHEQKIEALSTQLGELRERMAFLAQVC